MTAMTFDPNHLKPAPETPRTARCGATEYPPATGENTQGE